MEDLKGRKDNTFRVYLLPDEARYELMAEIREETGSDTVSAMESMSISIRAGEEVFKVSIRPGYDTVRSLKQRLSEISGIPAEEQVLKVGDRVLRNDVRFCEFTEWCHGMSLKRLQQKQATLLVGHGLPGVTGAARPTNEENVAVEMDAFQRTSPRGGFGP